jgi:ankyrin repeat protein
MLASCRNHFNITLLLIENGADINYINASYGDTSLIMASLKGNLEIVELLIGWRRGGANVYITNSEGESAYTVTTNSEVKILINCYITKQTKQMLKKEEENNEIYKSYKKTNMINL